MDTNPWIGPGNVDLAATVSCGSTIHPCRMPKRLLRLTIASLLLACAVQTTAKADCFDDAAGYHNVNPWILRAIAAVESGFKPVTVARNTDGSLDRGMTGINSVHLPQLARYGITASDLLDGCKSIYVAAWHLRNRINDRGNTWEAVGTYHSKTPSKRDVYINKVRRVINFWIERGIMPAPG
jgi:Transglycosylase SLT domain